MKVGRGIAVGFLALGLSPAGRVEALQNTPVVLMPMYSLEAVSVNSVPIHGAPKTKVTVSPGDVILAKIFIRNWSPHGQKLRSYQAKLDHAGFTSGSGGTVQPVGYSPGTNNEANAFIDLKDPEFVHKDLPSIPLTDSASEGYRWLNVLLDNEAGPVSAQDNTRYVCGTVRLQASADAAGTFKIGLIEDPMISGLLDPQNAPIMPIGYESLTVEIKPGTRWLRIESSDPPNGAVDGRILSSEAGKPDAAWKTVTMRFNSDVGEAAATDFEVKDGSASPPKIATVSASGADVVLTLDRAVRPGAWTTITHKASGSFTRIGRLSGDISNDGRTDAGDLMVLIRGLNGGIDLPAYRGDVDADGHVNARDALRLIDLLTEKAPGQNRLR